jgi:hypothetical protein
MSSNSYSIISPPLENRSFSSGDSSSGNNAANNVRKGYLGKEEDSQGPRFPKDVQKFTNRVGREANGEHEAVQVYSARSEFRLNLCINPGRTANDR